MSLQKHFSIAVCKDLLQTVVVHTISEQEAPHIHGAVEIRSNQ